MVCSFLCASRTHYSSRQELRKVRLSGRCVRWLSLPSTSTQIDTAGTGKFHVSGTDDRFVSSVNQPLERHDRPRKAMVCSTLLRRRVVAAAEVRTQRGQPFRRHYFHLRS